jgi:hypothetical protein
MIKNDRKHLKNLSEPEYVEALEKNPLLIRRPDLITSSAQNTMHFKFSGPE